MKLYRFQGYSFVTHPLYSVLCVHHPKSSLLPSPFIPLYPLLPPCTPFPLVITMLLSVCEVWVVSETMGKKKETMELSVMWSENPKMQGAAELERLLECGW